MPWSGKSAAARRAPRDGLPELVGYPFGNDCDHIGVLGGGFRPLRATTRQPQADGGGQDEKDIAHHGEYLPSIKAWGAMGKVVPGGRAVKLSTKGPRRSFSVFSTGGLRMIVGGAKIATDTTFQSSLPGAHHPQPLGPGGAVMIGRSNPSPDLWPPRIARRMDQKCLAFEMAWVAALSGGEAPRLEVYLLDVAEPERAILLGELLALEWAYRAKQGREPELQEYRRRLSRGWRSAGATLDARDGPHGANAKTGRQSLGAGGWQRHHPADQLEGQGRSAQGACVHFRGPRHVPRRPSQSGPFPALGRRMGTFRGSTSWSRSTRPCAGSWIWTAGTERR